MTGNQGNATKLTVQEALVRRFGPEKGTRIFLVGSANVLLWLLLGVGVVVLESQGGGLLTVLTVVAWIAGVLNVGFCAVLAWAWFTEKGQMSKDR